MTLDWAQGWTSNCDPGFLTLPSHPVDFLGRCREMRALVFEAFQGPIELRRMTDPKPAGEGVIIRVQATGICRSDWHGWMGHDPDVRLPHKPGHESAATAVEIGPQVHRWKPGDHVTVPFAVGCGTCPQCLSGNLPI